MKKKILAIALGAMVMFSISSTNMKATGIGGSTKNCWNSCRWNPVHGDCYTWGTGSYCGAMKASGTGSGTCVSCDAND